MPIQNTQRNVFLMSIITEKNQLQKKVAYMNEFPKRKVVEHNDLISSVAKMDKVPLKIFELAVSCIDTDNPSKDNIVFLSKRELFAFFDVSDSNKHSRFREAIEKMQKTAYFEIKEAKDKGYKMKSIVPIPMVEWNSYNDEVKIRFDIDIMPYLIELKQNFTQYALTDVMELNSKYSIIIYKWLCMHFNQYEHYQNKGGRRYNQLEEYRNPSILINELRVLTDTVTEYKRFTHFETRVLKTAIQEINEHTHYSVTYDKIKKGRTIDSIQFHITKKEQPQELNGEYKVREQDPAYLQSKKNREEQTALLSAKAMQSPYTMELITSTLLSPLEMTDINLMANLQQEVYPFYKQLEELIGLQGVRKHLEYVSSKKLDYSKPNLVKYLKTAVMRYLDSGDTEQPEESKTKFLKQPSRTIEEVAKDYLDNL
jgi:plasmid replication initiation protein